MRTPFLAAAAIATLLAGVACGDDDDSDTTPTPTTGAGSPTSPATGTPTTRPGTTSTPGASPTTGTPSSSPTTGVTPFPGSTSPVTKPAVPPSFSGQALLKDVRTGVQATNPATERIVFEFQGTALPPAKVEYVQGVSQCGSGNPVTISGGAVLSVSFTQAAAHTEQGQPTFTSNTVAGAGAPITQAKAFCDFEGVVGWGVGVSAQKPFVVTQLADPPRLVIDIAK